MTLEDIKLMMTEDETLKKTIMEMGKWPNPIPEELQPYNRCAGEFSAQEGLTLRGHRIVLPKENVKQALRIAHGTPHACRYYS